MTHGGAVDRWADALFDLWEAQWAQAAMAPAGLKSLVEAWSAEPVVGEMVAQSMGQMSEFQARAADVFKLWLVALTGHALTANVQAPAPQGVYAPQGTAAPQGAKSGHIDGRPADASQQSQDRSHPAPRPPADGKGGAGSQRVSGRGPGGSGGAARTKAARVASGKRGARLEQSAGRAAGVARRTGAAAPSARRGSRKTPRKPARR